MEIESNTFKSLKFTRVKMACHVLRGRPAVYKVKFKDGRIWYEPWDCLVAECSFIISAAPPPKNTVCRWVLRKLLQGLEIAWEKVNSYL